MSSFHEDDKLKQGVFTYFLVKALNGEAAGPDGLVTFHDMFWTSSPTKCGPSQSSAAKCGFLSKPVRRVAIFCSRRPRQ